MKKKIFALALAAVMLVSGAMTASAATGTMPDLDCNGWWVDHTDGLEMKDGVTYTVTFDTQYVAGTDTDGQSNWDSPIFIVYTSDVNKIGNVDPDNVNPAFVEYWVGRVDNWGWGTAGATYTTTGDWDNFLATMAAGCEGKLVATLTGTTLDVSIAAAGLEAVYSMTVDTTKPVYLSISGQFCTITDIVWSDGQPDEEVPSETTTESNTEDNIVDEKGDLGSAAYMVLLAGAALVVVAFVSKKKFA